MMTAKMADRDSRDEMVKAFRLFDDDETGKISFRNLKRVAMELGETISDEELQELMDTKNMRKKMYILKPNASSCGRGIRVVQGNQDFIHREETIVSFYLDRPLLINQKKFDMRIYVLVSSFNPLRVYIY